MGREWAPAFAGVGNSEGMRCGLRLVRVQKAGDHKGRPYGGWGRWRVWRITGTRFLGSAAFRSE